MSKLFVITKTRSMCAAPHQKRLSDIILLSHFQKVLLTLKACSRPAASSKAWQKIVLNCRSVFSTLSWNSMKSASNSYKEASFVSAMSTFSVCVAFCWRCCPLTTLLTSRQSYGFSENVLYVSKNSSCKNWTLWLRDFPRIPPNSTFSNFIISTTVSRRV